MNQKKRLEFRPIRRDRYGEAKPRVGIEWHYHEQGTPEAGFAMRLLERISANYFSISGEDSAGRQAVSILPPKEVVARVCDTADEAFKEFRVRGWMIDVPTLAELEDQIKEEEDKAENK